MLAFFVNIFLYPNIYYRANLNYMINCGKTTLVIKMKENVLIDKSIKFAARIVKLQKYLSAEKKESVISRQIIRSGTSIGANINEANYGNSKADFISKLHIALKETAETEYWIKLLNMSEYIDDEISDSLIKDCLELKRLLISSINTAKSNK